MPSATGGVLQYLRNMPQGWQTQLKPCVNAASGVAAGQMQHLRALLTALGAYTERVKVCLSPWYIVPSLPSCRLYIHVVGNQTLKGGIIFSY